MAKRIPTPIWKPHDYTQLYLFDEPTHTPKEIRREYTRMRDIMMKRANRLEKAGMKAQADYIREMMPKLGEIGANDYEVAQRLVQGHKLFENRAYSIQGIKELQKHIQSATGEIVPLGRVLEFDEYMQSWRLSAFSKLIVSSRDAADMHDDEYQDIGGNFAEFYTLFLSERG